MEQASPSKRIRSDIPPEDILHILGIQKVVVSYLNAKDLLVWDQVCKAFLAVAEAQWGLLASEKFGVLADDGKKGWKLGNRFLKRPIMLKIADKADFGFGQEDFNGTGRVATNQNIVAAVADEVSSEVFPAAFPSTSDERIAIRDADSLNYCRTVASPMVNWKVAICGRLGCEIVVTSNARDICAIRCKTQQSFAADSALGPEFRGLCRQAPNGVPILGCERFLLYVCSAHVVLYEVDACRDTLLNLKMTRLVCGHEAIAGGIQTSDALEWSQCQQEFIFFEPHSKSIQVWKIDHGLGSMFPVDTIPRDFPITGIALSTSFVVGSSNEKILCVWSRDSKDLVHEELCDLPEESRIDPADLHTPLCMVVVNGDLLVTSSNEGNALCVWNLKSGVLLKRHTEAFRLGFKEAADSLPDGIDTSSMVFVKRLGTFVCMSWGMQLWAFPWDQVMEKKVKSIQRREKTITGALAHLLR